jgi:hypothetical protein
MEHPNIARVFDAGATDTGLPYFVMELVRGELDWIVMKCLEKDRARRYETANGLAKDLQRYLDDEPVLARPPTARYRLAKFARRNKSLVATTLAIMLALTVGLGVATWQAVEAMRQRDRSEHQLYRWSLGQQDPRPALAIRVGFARGACGDLSGPKASMLYSGSYGDPGWCCPGWRWSGSPPGGRPAAARTRGLLGNTISRTSTAALNTSTSTRVTARRVLAKLKKPSLTAGFFPGSWTARLSSCPL